MVELRVGFDHEFLGLAEQLGRWFDVSFGPITSFRMVGQRGSLPGGVDAALARARGLPVEHRLTISYQCASTNTKLTLRIRDRPDEWQILVGREVGSVEEGPPPEGWNDAALELARRAIRDLGVRRALIEANRAHATWLPHPPLARYDSAILTTQAEVEAAYEDAPAFWKAWDGVEWYGEQALAWRAKEARYQETWLQRVVPSNLALARIARPGTTHYGVVHPQPWERPFYEGPARRLKPAGYHPEKHIVAFTCWLAASEHLCAADICAVLELRKKGTDADGRPVSEVHVFFGRKEMAERERRPLLDVGARVFYDEDETGETKELTV